MADSDPDELASQLRDYTILMLLLRKGLISEFDVREQIDIVRAEVPSEHPAYAYLMEQLDRMERTMPSSAHGSPISNDPMIPTEF